VLACAKKVGTRKLASAVRSKNTCKPCAFGTGGQRGGLHNEYSDRVEVWNKNSQPHPSENRDPIPVELFEQNSIAELRALSGKQLEDLGRLETPLYKPAGADYYQAISVEQALDQIATRMHAAQPERSFFYGSGRSSNEAAFLLQLFARLFGSNHINNCSYYCHQASGVGLGASIGTGTATIQYGDLHKADLIFVLGANPASNHPRFVKVLLECRQRGGQVIIINPAREAGLVRFASPSNFKSMIAGGGEVASEYLQPNIGGDIALLSGIAKSLLQQDAQDQYFIDTHCDNFQDYRTSIENMEWDAIVQEAGVARAEIEHIAQLYAQSERTVFAWGMGLTHHIHGTDNIQAVANLALLRGMIGGVGKGLLPLRGHSNVQGVGSMGFTPKLKAEVFSAIEQKLKVKLPQTEGMDTLACVQAAAAGSIDFALLLGGNLFSANPDSEFAAQALNGIPCKVMISSTLNQTHVNGVDGENYILPVRVRDEEQQATTQESMFNFLRLSDGGFDRIPSLQSEVALVSALAQRVIDREIFDFTEFTRHDSIRRAIAVLIPGFEKMAHIDASREEFHIAGRHLDQPVFATPTGKANFAPPPKAQAVRSTTAQKPAQSADFMLTSVRSEGQFNTIIYSEADVYRRQTHRKVLFMHRDDIHRLQLKENDLVDVSNATGTMRNLHLAAYDIKAGNVMTYFPEANILVPQTCDQRSRTPAFKSVEVSVKPAS